MHVTLANCKPTLSQLGTLLPHPDSTPSPVLQSVDKIPDLKDTQHFFAELGNAQLAWGLSEFPKKDLYTLMKCPPLPAPHRPLYAQLRSLALSPN